MAVVFDDDSDLTSLEDDDGQHVNNAAARSANDIHLDYESSLTSEDESSPDYEHTTSHNGAQRAIATSHVSPSRIGSSLSRPVRAAGLITYGSRRTRTRESFKRPKTPRHSPEPPPDPEGYDSPLSPLPPSPSPRKRRASSSTRHLLSSPSKRAKGRKSKESNRVPKLTPEPQPASSRNMKLNGHASQQNSLTSSTKRRRGSNKGHITEEPLSSVSVGARKRSTIPSKPKSSKPSTWSFESLGPLVWVRVNRKGNVVDDESIESFWWPGMVEPAAGRQRLLRVRLLVPPSGRAPSDVVSIKRPSSSNIVSYKEHSFTVNSFWLLPSSSASSQPVGFEDLKSHWVEGCRKIAEEDTQRNDGFPTSLTALLSQPLHHTEDAEDDSASRASPERIPPPSASVEDEPWSPPPPDPNVAIPGEPVLSTTKTKGYYGKFYPAKVIAYVAPSGPNALPRYTVHFMDNLHEDVTRDMFYIYEQDEFGTCKLGEFESVESLNEKDDEDELGESVSADATNQLVIPDLPKLPVPPSEAFCDLTMLEQTSYIVPILAKIIENNYKPAEQRVSAFLDGGRGRMEVSKKVLQKGFLTRSDLNQLASIVKCWAMNINTPDGEVLRANSPQEVGVHNTPEQDFLSPPAQPHAAKEPSSPDDPLVTEESRHPQDKEQVPSLPPSSLPPSSSIDGSPSSTPNANGVGGDDRGIIIAAAPASSQPFADDLRTENDIQSGGAAPQFAPSIKRSFKDLLNHEKIHFCTDVLLNEAVIQLLLWRAGKRRSIDLLSETEELLLHESGANLASEFDIAHTVQDLRMKKEKLLQNRMQSMQQGTQSTGGTRSRPRKV